MKRKILITTITSCSLIAASPFAIISCSSSNIQSEVNKIYLNIYQEFLKNNYAKSSSNVFNVYDGQSLIENLNNSPLSEIDKNKFEINISNIDYSQASQGILQFKFNLIDKKTNSIIEPTLSTQDNYYSQIIQVRGFEKMEQTLVDEIYRIFNDVIKPFQVILNPQGNKWIQDNFDNLNENISFNKNDINQANYFLNYIELPQINSSNFRLSRIILTNYLATKPIVYLNKTSVNFNFWFTLEKVNDPNQKPITINLTNENLKILNVRKRI